MQTGGWTRLFPWLHKNKGESNPAEIRFLPRLTITRYDEWVYLELVLENRSDWTVWVEEATVILDDLDAVSQSEVATGQARHEILQNVRANDTLSVSLAVAIYNAAGRPQGQYSCLVSTDVRYRVFDEWCDAKLETCRVEMAGLTAVDLHSARWYDKKIKQINDSVDLTAKEHKG